MIHLKEYLPGKDSRLAKSEFLHDEEGRDEAKEANKVVTNEASLKLTADAEEADESNNVANKSNFSGPTTFLSMIIVLMLTVLIV